MTTSKLPDDRRHVPAAASSEAADRKPGHPPAAGAISIIGTARKPADLACIMHASERMDTTLVQVCDVPVDVVATLKARAEARGQSLASYLRDLLAREAQVPPIEDPAQPHRL
jgi:hypothetical protein